MKAGKRKTSVWLAAVLMGLLLAAGGCSGEDDTIYASEGAASDPVDISGLIPYTGSVGADPSYYEIGVTITNTISVYLSGMRYDLDLIVYDNDPDPATAFGGQPLCASVTIDITEEKCLGMTATGTPIFIKVVSHSQFGSTFSLTVTETP